MKLFYPTLDGFIYDLQCPLNADQIEIEQNRQAFQSRLPPNTRLNTEQTEPSFQTLGIPEQPLLTGSEDKNINGYFFPVLINDTYALQINCSIDNETEPQYISDSLVKLKETIEPFWGYHQRLTFGKTWLVSGWLAEESFEEEKIAIKCYQSLLSKDKEQWKEDLYGQGKFLKSSIFEIWNPQSPYPQNHLIICLFPNQETFNQSDIYYPNWMALFAFRHKIAWAYHQSRKIKNVLKSYYQKVYKITQDIQESQNLSVSLTRLQNRFNEIQPILDQYTRDLLSLAFQKETIEINLENYKRCLTSMKKN